MEVSYQYEGVSSFCTVSQYSTVWLHHNLVNHSLVYFGLGYFQPFVILHNVLVITVYVCHFGYAPIRLQDKCLRMAGSRAEAPGVFAPTVWPCPSQRHSSLPGRGMTHLSPLSRGRYSSFHLFKNHFYFPFCEFLCSYPLPIFF